MQDINFLLDVAEATARLASGRRPSAPNGNGRALSVAARHAPGHTERARRWTPDEDAFLREALGRLSTEEICAALSRSDKAIKIRWTRKGYPAPSKQPDEMTGNQIADALGVDVHAVMALIDRGILPGRKLPGSTRNIRVVKTITFYRWVVNPKNWPYFLQCVYEDARVGGSARVALRGTARIGDLHLRRLVERQKARWPDRWLSTGEVAEMLHCSVGAVHGRCRSGRIPGAVQWQNWYVRRSVAETIRILPKGYGAALNWSDLGDQFLVLATAVGLKQASIGRLMGAPYRGGLWNRLETLRQDGLQPGLVAALNETAPPGGKILFDVETGRLWADWRPWRFRFPGLTRAARLFVTGEDLCRRDRYYVLGVMDSWLAWFRPEEGELIHRLLYSNGAYTPVLRERYADLLALGIDPF